MLTKFIVVIVFQYKVIVLYTINVYSTACQLYINKTLGLVIIFHVPILSLWLHKISGGHKIADLVVTRLLIHCQVLHLQFNNEERRK